LFCSILKPDSDSHTDLNGEKCVKRFFYRRCTSRNELQRNSLFGMKLSFIILITYVFHSTSAAVFTTHEKLDVKDPCKVACPKKDFKRCDAEKDKVFHRWNIRCETRF
uniref:Kazal-like domain-containing protein n=1 Tax=Ascaris lumbricoides TaxID=6252 RepID=A0A0M3I6L9_ASCLU